MLNDVMNMAITCPKLVIQPSFCFVLVNVMDLNPKFPEFDNMWVPLRYRKNNKLETRGRSHYMWMCLGLWALTTKKQRKTSKEK